MIQHSVVGVLLVIAARQLAFRALEMCRWTDLLLSAIGNWQVLAVHYLVHPLGIVLLIQFPSRLALHNSRKHALLVSAGALQSTRALVNN